VTPEFAEQIVQDHVDQGKVLAEGLIFSTSEAAPENTMVEKQVRVVLRNCGRIDPEKIDEYIAAGGYEALKKVLDSMPRNR
jgi:NADH-quinone oxidoreductase subunit F